MGDPAEAQKEIEHIRVAEPDTKVDWQLVWVHITMKNDGEAEVLLDSLLKSARERAKPSAGSTGQVCAALGEVKARRGDKVAGKKLMVEAIEATEKALGPDHPRLAIVLESYARLFPDDGIAAAARAAKIRERNKDNMPQGFKVIAAKHGF